jgi:hypothetical protein
MKRITRKEPGDIPVIRSGRDAPTTRHGQVRLRSLDQLDGRTQAARVARTIVASLSADLGSDPSTAERLLAERAALSSVILQDLEASWLAGKTVNLSEYATLLNALSRTCARLGLKRVPRDVTPTLGDLLREDLAARQRHENGA